MPDNVTLPMPDNTTPPPPYPRPNKLRIETTMELMFLLEITKLATPSGSQAQRKNHSGETESTAPPRIHHHPN